MKQKAFKPKVVELIELLQNKKVKSENLSCRERRQIIKYFLEEQSEVSNTQIGGIVGTSGQNVGRIKKSILRNAASEIDDLDIKILAASLKTKKEEYQRKAAKKEDYSLAWRIEMDFIEKMQSLGFIHKEADNVNLHKYGASVDVMRNSFKGYDKGNGQRN